MTGRNAASLIAAGLAEFSARLDARHLPVMRLSVIAKRTTPLSSPAVHIEDRINPASVLATKTHPNRAQRIPHHGPDRTSPIASLGPRFSSIRLQ